MDPAPPQSLGSQAWSPSQEEPWLVAHLLGDHDKPGTQEHLAKILKVVGEVPARVLCIMDGAHHIRAVVHERAFLQLPFYLSLSGRPLENGEVIVLKNYRVCFRKGTKLEDCEFYLTLDCFQVLTGSTWIQTPVGDCNKEPLVLEKIKELWTKYTLNLLNQTAKKCLDYAKQMDSEELAMYDTKWQMRRKQDKPDQDTFMVPSKFLGKAKDLKKNEATEAAEGALAAGGEAAAVKQKHVVPLKCVSHPKKSWAEATQVQHHPTMESDRETPQGHEGNAGVAAEGPNAGPNQPIGAPEE